MPITLGPLIFAVLHHGGRYTFYVCIPPVIASSSSVASVLMAMVP